MLAKFSLQHSSFTTIQAEVCDIDVTLVTHGEHV
jgi:hypothetical protein